MNKFKDKIVLLILFISILSCSANKKKMTAEVKDNSLIEKLYLKDVEIRELDAKTDTVNLKITIKYTESKYFNYWLRIKL